MPAQPVNKLRHGLERAVRAFSFHRSATQQNEPPPSTSTTPFMPTSSHSSHRPPNVHPTRSFPNLSRIRHTSSAHKQHRPPNVVNRRSSRSFSNSMRTLSLSHHRKRSSQSLPQPQPQNVHHPSYNSQSTISTFSTNSAATSPPPKNESAIPPPSNLLRRLSAHRMRSLSLNHRPSSSSIHSESSFPNNKPWSSGGPSLFSPSPTDDNLSWSRIFRSSFDLRDKTRWKKRHLSYSCSDFEIAEEPHVVEIGQRLPDRSHSGTEEDVFGRRRPDFSSRSFSMLTSPSSRVLACDVHPSSHQSQQAPKPAPKPPKPHKQSSRLTETAATHFIDTPLAKPDRSAKAPLIKEADNEHFDEQEAIRHITKAIDSSKGRLRKSANMNKAFTSVIKSGDGFLRKSEIIQQTLNSENSKDPSMIILLDPESNDPANMHAEGVSTASEESGSVETMKSVRVVPVPNFGFSTSMTARQCAATLETILRDMACRVSRYADDVDSKGSTLRLKATRVAGGARLLDRKVKVMVTVREEDHIRTSVSFRRIPTMYGSRDSHLPLCSEIRDRFQREWPAVVEALYIRVPNPQGATVSSDN